MGISQVHLVNFRNHENLKIECDPSKNVMILGDNGLGKTNLLEAISLFAPGRGMRNASNDELVKFNNNEFCISINTNFEIDSTAKILLQEKKKNVTIDGKRCTSFSNLLSIMNVMWITPQMNTIFSGEKSYRRMFFDRIISNFNAYHIENLIKYEEVKSKRIKLLKNKNFDELWLKNLEKIMAEFGTKIALTRLQVINYLQTKINSESQISLKSTIKIDGEIENLCIYNPIVEAQSIFTEKLKEARQIDSNMKKTTVGTHLTDFYLILDKKNIKSSLCSTGEQKLLLSSIILSAIQPKSILLLDDIIEHLDDENYNSLLEAILEKKCQIWVSGIDCKKIDTLFKNFSIYKFNHTKLYEYKNA